MKYLKHFANAQEAATILATWPFNTISSIEGQEGASFSEGVTMPDYSEPFYIDVHGTSLELTTNDGIELSTDKINWTPVGRYGALLPTGKTYIRVTVDQSTRINIHWRENSSDYDIGGNVNSLIKVNFENDTNCYYFGQTFKNLTKLKSAGNLILPADTLTKDCYMEMFYGCTSLTTAPALPATTLAGTCYKHMFGNCTSLTATPKISATILAGSCCHTMFQNCTSLTTATLPAAKPVDSCYLGMFMGCTALTTAPELPESILDYRCYSGMFQGCTNLNYIKCLATDISEYQCLNSWVDGVAATGTFVKDPSMSNWPTGTSGIPSGWTVQDAA